jgi:hypothetical protein
MRWIVSAAVLAIACAPAPPRVQAPLQAPRASAPVAEPIAPSEPREIVAPTAAELGGERIGEHREIVDGETRIHLVLREGECYRAWLGAAGSFSARLEDEHEHTIASAHAERSLWLGAEPICPRWSGSFTLVVETAEPRLEVHVILVRAD